MGEAGYTIVSVREELQFFFDLFQNSPESEAEREKDRNKRDEEGEQLKESAKDRDQDQEVETTDAHRRLLKQAARKEKVSECF